VPEAAVQTPPTNVSSTVFPTSPTIIVGLTAGTAKASSTCYDIYDVPFACEGETTVKYSGTPDKWDVSFKLTVTGYSAWGYAYLYGSDLLNTNGHHHYWSGVGGNTWVLPQDNFEYDFEIGPGGITQRDLFVIVWFINLIDLYGDVVGGEMMAAFLLE